MLDPKQASVPHEGATLRRRLLDAWLLIAAFFGEAQTLVIIGLIYVFVIGPSAIIARLLRNDFLSKRGLRLPGSAWREADSRPPLLENVKQPF